MSNLDPSEKGEADNIQYLQLELLFQNNHQEYYCNTDYYIIYNYNQTAVMAQASLVLGEQQKVLQDLGSRTTDQHVRITRIEADLCSWQMARKVQCP